MYGFHIYQVPHIAKCFNTYLRLHCVSKMSHLWLAGTFWQTSTNFDNFWQKYYWECKESNKVLPQYRPSWRKVEAQKWHLFTPVPEFYQFVLNFLSRLATHTYAAVWHYLLPKSCNQWSLVLGCWETLAQKTRSRGFRAAAAELTTCRVAENQNCVHRVW